MVFFSFTVSYFNVYQHRRHAFYRGLVESQDPLNPEFDDDVSWFNSCDYDIDLDELGLQLRLLD